jgi:redox-sensitive bicupin YhaK (pirin superfamily)
MTAGRGIIHNEQPPDGVTVHSLQLWVNLPAANKMVEPRTQNLVAADLPLRREQGAEIRVFSGKSGDVIAPTKNYSPVIMLEMRREAGARIRQELPADSAGLRKQSLLFQCLRPVHDPGPVPFHRFFPLSRQRVLQSQERQVC